MRAALTAGCFVGIPTLLAACSPNYSQSASDFSGGVSALHTYSTNLSQILSSDREVFYAVERSIHQSRTTRTNSCADDLVSCYITDNIQQKRDEDDAKKALTIEAAEVPASPPPPANVDAQKLGVPEVCLSSVQNVGPLATTKLVSEKKISDSETKIMSALDEYAQGLMAITKQSDSTDYKAAATKLSSTVGTLAGTAGTIAGGAAAAVGPVAQAVTSIVLEANLIALETRRYNALKRAVLAACIPVHNLATAEKIVLTTRHNAVVSYNQQIIQDLLNPNVPAPVRTANDATLTKAAANLRSIGPDPTNTVNKIASAHDKLVVAVTSGQGQTAALLGDIGTFADEAKALRDALQGKSGSSSKPPTSPSS